MTRTNQLFSELAVGDNAAITRVVTPDDLYVFARVSGNLNPANLPATDDGEGGTPGAPAMRIGSLFLAVLGNLLPGKGTLHEAQSLRFRARARIGDTLTALDPSPSS
jgi:phosphate butyryltransferase